MTKILRKRHSHDVLDSDTHSLTLTCISFLTHLIFGSEGNIINSIKCVLCINYVLIIS